MTYAPPLFQDLAKSATTITRILELPCSNPLAVYIEAGEAIAGGLIWGYATPDPKELYHAAVGEPLVHSIRATFDDAFDASGGSFKKTRRFLGKLLGAVDRFVWWQFLVESGTQGLISASSAIKRMNQCDLFNDPNYGSGGAYIGAISDDGIFAGLDFSIDQEESKFYPVTGSHITAVPHRTALIACSAQFEDFSGVPVQTASRIIRLDTGGALDFDDNFNDDAESFNANHVWYKSKSAFSQPTRLQAEWANFDGDLPLHEAFPIGSTMNAYFYS